jgi:hypothetical protein
MLRFATVSGSFAEGIKAKTLMRIEFPELAPLCGWNNQP